ncbi:hypothetical protein CCMA1212_000366 [Trichoderma ghanense]|uniref:Uncharacterized protein n=1 Tax=Trichoderma ghanense TaxID=65468 RepID=A0ABY2HGH2_9HYPO
MLCKALRHRTRLSLQCPDRRLYRYPPGGGTQRTRTGTRTAETADTVPPSCTLSSFPCLTSQHGCHLRPSSARRFARPLHTRLVPLLRPASLSFVLHPPASSPRASSSSSLRLASPAALLAFPASQSLGPKVNIVHSGLLPRHGRKKPCRARDAANPIRPVEPAPRPFALVAEPVSQPARARPRQSPRHASAATLFRLLRAKAKKKKQRIAGFFGISSLGIMR